MIWMRGGEPGAANPARILNFGDVADRPGRKRPSSEHLTLFGVAIEWSRLVEIET